MSFIPFPINHYTSHHTCLSYLLRVTVCIMSPFLLIIYRRRVFLSAEIMEKPVSGLQNTVPSTGFTLRLNAAAELVI